MPRRASAYTEVTLGIKLSTFEGVWGKLGHRPHMKAHTVLASSIPSGFRDARSWSWPSLLGACSVSSSFGAATVATQSRRDLERDAPHLPFPSLNLHICLACVPIRIHLAEEVELEAVDDYERKLPREDWGLEDVRQALLNVDDDRWFREGGGMVEMKLKGPNRASTFRRVFAGLSGAVYGSLKVGSPPRSLPSSSPVLNPIVRDRQDA